MPFQHLLLVGTALAALLADQLSKLWVTQNFLPGESRPAEGFFRFTYVTNTGAAFGLLPNQSLLFILIAVGVVVATIVYYRRLGEPTALVGAGLGLTIGGALGNLIDRVRFGYVVDFLDFRVWPVFNLADSLIILGMVLLGWSIIFGTPKPEAAEKAPADK